MLRCMPIYSFFINIPDNLFCFRISDLGKPSRNQDGVQDNMAIKYEMSCSLWPSLPYICLSYLGPFVFTRTLLPLLESTAANGDDVRIVNVSVLDKVPPVYWALYRLDLQVMQTLLSWIIAQRKLGIISSRGLHFRRCHDTVGPIAWILLHITDVSQRIFQTCRSSVDK